MKERPSIADQCRAEIPDIDAFCRRACDTCNANDWYCPAECDTLEKARRMPFEKIRDAYVRHEGDIVRVFRYIINYRERNG